SHLGARHQHHRLHASVRDGVHNPLLVGGPARAPPPRLRTRLPGEHPVVVRPIAHGEAFRRPEHPHNLRKKFLSLSHGHPLSSSRSCASPPRSRESPRPPWSPIETSPAR